MRSGPPTMGQRRLLAASTQVRNHHSEFRCRNCAGPGRLNVLDVCSSQVPRGRAPGHAPEDHAVEEGIATQPIAPMDAAGSLTCPIEATDDPVVLTQTL